MTDPHEEFLAKIEEDLADPTPKMVYADWLEERNDGLVKHVRAWAADVEFMVAEDIRLVLRIRKRRGEFLTAAAAIAAWDDDEVHNVLDASSGKS